jgi:hypothetical protein
LGWCLALAAWSVSVEGFGGLLVHKWGGYCYWLWLLPALFDVHGGWLFAYFGVQRIQLAVCTAWWSAVFGLWV